MHIPDGFLTTPVWASLAALSLPSAAAFARKAQSGLEDGRVPLMGVMGAFVFAAQMINFPVGIGASGHLVGSALLAATLGPAAAAVVMTAILVIQALIFQDGGLLALGANVFNMAIAGVLAGYWPYRILSGTRGRMAGLFFGGFLSVIVSAALCLGELALSGVRMPAQVLGISVLVFSVTGLLEGLITVAVIGSLTRMNPRWIREPAGEGRRALALLACAALVLASTGFLVASALPDGLERVAGLVGLAGHERAVLAAPLPDYDTLVIDNPWLRRATAGLLGLGLTTLACFLLGKWISRWRSA
ncbi:MAG: energy-coupling factor ABC transporter permease [Bryobacterales bacterium]|nr:energy-coupling factor ABC transporter permease [Bryobacterales bacterium]